MTTIPDNSYDIPKDGYVAFDAMSLRKLIINRLNEQNVFTDQNFIGSNLASIIDIIAYSYHTLIYYLNKTSSETLFSEAELYENINRIVKLIDYSPIGFQTSTLSFSCSAKSLAQGLYTIPRYSYLIVNNIPFSFNEDITFVKTVNDIEESLNELAQQKLLYQGYYQEYPLYTAAGEDNEIMIVNPGNELVDHFNIDVYVKSAQTNTWKQFSKTPNLFLESGTKEVYQLRLNENKRYEIKFGNNINGLKLQQGDKIAVYYLSSKGNNGIIGSNALNNVRLSTRLVRYNTTQFAEIFANLPANQYRLLTNAELGGFSFTNNTGSTPVKEAETPDQIRASAPANFKSQYRLVTIEDYETFIKTNFANIISDVKCVNNWDYMAGYLQYFYTLGLTRPDKTDRAVFNQVQYADSCNFNNIYLLVVPRSNTNSLEYLLPSQKELIRSSIGGSQTATTETTFIDPVYKFLSIGVAESATDIFPMDDEGNSFLEIVKKSSSRVDNQSIINGIVNVFNQYFSRENAKLGMAVDIRFLTQQILAVEGVERFFTTRIDNTNVRVEGLSLFCWNPSYPGNDKLATVNNIPLRYFEYPLFSNINELGNKIKIVTSTAPTIIT
jgi:hypothetical protein